MVVLHARRRFLNVALLGLLLLLTCGCWNQRVQASEVEVLSMEKLQELTTLLRQGDHRLVRPGYHQETGELQQQHQSKVCPSVIPSLVHTLNYYHSPPAYENDSDDDSRWSNLHLRGLVAEVLHLCTTNNPTNRHQIAMVGRKEENSNKGEDSSSVHTGLLNLIHDAQEDFRTSTLDTPDAQKFTIMHAMGNAAEAIWILTFNSPDHHKSFVDLEVVDILTDIILMCKPPVEDMDYHISFECVPRTVMWCLAALQNLAASYCATESGYCHWDWVEDPQHQMVLQTPLTVDGEGVRTEVLQHRELLQEVVTVLRFGPVYHPHGHVHTWDNTPFEGQEDELPYAWPSRSIIAQLTNHIVTHNEEPQKQQEEEEDILDHVGDEWSHSIISWAAAGLLKNLALSPEFKKSYLMNEGYESLLGGLCDMYHSPDWLEQLKADQALYHLGLLEECPPLYDDTKCENYKHWRAIEDQSSCAHYEEQNWCIEYGHLENEHGVTANDACCVCGGGNVLGWNKFANEEF